MAYIVISLSRLLVVNSQAYVAARFAVPEGPDYGEGLRGQLKPPPPLHSTFVNGLAPLGSLINPPYINKLYLA